jgi:hypothetical protein
MWQLCGLVVRSNGFNEKNYMHEPRIWGNGVELPVFLKSAVTNCSCVVVESAALHGDVRLSIRHQAVPTK